MENNYRIPNMDELKKRRSDYNKKHPEYDFRMPDILLKKVIELLECSEKFLIFLYNKKYDSNFENPHVIFGQVLYYIKKCHDEGDIKEIKNILIFCDKCIKNKNTYVGDLVNTGFLEILDIYPEMLNDLVGLMPNNLKKMFLKYYSSYLK